jgi:hypothetical protein
LAPGHSPVAVLAEELLNRHRFSATGLLAAHRLVAW